MSTLFIHFHNMSTIALSQQFSFIIISQMIKKHRRTTSTSELKQIINMQQYQSVQNDNEHRIRYLKSVCYPSIERYYSKQTKQNVDELVKSSAKKLKQKVVLVERIDYLQEVKERQLFQFGKGLRYNGIQINEYNLADQGVLRYQQNLFDIPQIKAKQNKKQLKSKKISNKQIKKQKIDSRPTSRKISSMLPNVYCSSNPKDKETKRNNKLIQKKQRNIKVNNRQKSGSVMLTARTHKQQNKKKIKSRN